MTENGGSSPSLPPQVPFMDESQFNTLRELSKDMTLSQRDLSKRMGLSLGRVNYIVNALLKKGYIKAKRFKNSRNKIGYMYIITPKGISTKLLQTYDFLQRKTEEFERLRSEIEELRQETQIKGTTPGRQHAVFLNNGNSGEYNGKK
jgi:EPS-associated MarR family transcriptional regulator